MQLLKKWAPVFKNYVKRVQDHMDCLAAIEEVFLERDTHWAALVKVSTSHTHQHTFCVFNRNDQTSFKLIICCVLYLRF